MGIRPCIYFRLSGTPQGRFWPAGPQRRFENLGAGIGTAALGMTVIAAGGQAQAAPDVVVILLEHPGASIIGPVRRSVSVATPKMDALAAAGTTFT